MCERQIHFAGGVGEYAHPEDAIYQECGVGVGVAVGDAQQHDESLRDFADDSALDAYLGAADALNNCPHSCVIYIVPARRAPVRPDLKRKLVWSAWALAYYNSNQ